MCATGIVEPEPTYAMLADVAVLVLRISVVGSCLRIEVWDRSSDLPERQVCNEDDEHGRGLLLVDAPAIRDGGDSQPRWHRQSRLGRTIA